MLLFVSKHLPFLVLLLAMTATDRELHKLVSSQNQGWIPQDCPGHPWWHHRFHSEGLRNFPCPSIFSLSFSLHLTQSCCDFHITSYDPHNVGSRLACISLYWMTGNDYDIMENPMGGGAHRSCRGATYLPRASFAVIRQFKFWNSRDNGDVWCSYMFINPRRQIVFLCPSSIECIGVASGTKLGMAQYESPNIT